MDFSVDVSDVEDVPVRWRAAVAEIGAGCAAQVASTTTRGVSLAKGEAPTRTDALRKSIRGDVVSRSAMGATGEIAAYAPHAAPVIEGARPHTIRGNPLAFEVGGTTVFARVVHHPGNKPNDFVARVVPMIENDLEVGVAAQVARALEKFGG